MVEINYDPELDLFTLHIGSEEEIIEAKELFDKLSVEQARIEYLLSMIHDNRKKRLADMTSFMDFIKNIVVRQGEIEDKINEAIENNDKKKVDMYKVLMKATLDTKNTAKELRYAIKNLEIEEGRLKAKLLEMTI
jgi:hypothetical protein